MPRNEAPRPVPACFAIAAEEALSVLPDGDLAALTPEEQALLYSSILVRSGQPLDTYRQRSAAERQAGKALGNALIGKVLIL